MDWENDALDLIADAPRFVRKFAVGNVEDFAHEHDYTRITAGVVQEQGRSGRGQVSAHVSEALARAPDGAIDQLGHRTHAGFLHEIGMARRIRQRLTGAGGGPLA